MTLRTKPTSTERELLASLGLPAGASSQDVETAHDELVAYLEKAPAELRPWARREIAAIDEAFAVLSDPTIDRSPQITTTPATDAWILPQAPVAAGAAAKTAPAVDEDEIEELEQDHPATRHGRREAERKARAAANRSAASRPAGIGRDRLIKRLAIGGAVLIGAVAIAAFGFNMNGGTGVPAFNGSPAPVTAGASPAVDQAQLTALMQKIAADPKDIASLQSIGDLYYQAGDYATASTWMNKVLAVDSNNVTARLALGAALFNQGNPSDAEKQWRQVLSTDPKNVEAYYDLGFMYLSQNPPDKAKVKEAWGKVIEISPDSDVAKTVATHLASLEGSPAPSGAAASGAPASASPSTPAATPAPSK
jgi:cytochrome c-type biogenesis protein CcmH/NrfG